MKNEAAGKDELSIQQINYLIKTVMPFSILNFIVMIYLSTRPFLISIVPIFFIAGLFAIQKNKKLSAKVVALNIGMFFFMSAVSGVKAPGWILFIPPLIPSIFLLEQKKSKLIYVLMINFGASLANYLSGKDSVTIIAVALAMATISVKLLRAQTFMEKQKETIREEREKSERLLENILPLSIVNQLKTAPGTIAEKFETSTILFADIVGFTVLSEKIAPEALVNLLNKIFSHFDHLIEKSGLEKIKTIGDAYMVAGGLPLAREDHAEAVANLALEMKNELYRFNRENDQAFDMRIGIHTGPAVAGVIGIKKFIYDVWGDTVNTASRMESHSEPGQIQVTEQSYQALKDKFDFFDRGFIAVKGKGSMHTYFLKGRK
ncbi:MAG: adenylate/guanylate cyclase domain-containing protein [SAR324 cluster bacterium]|nr:adenylate/guanylate cyclase domain-containing protein [SAR324 cluster bacterium]